MRISARNVLFRRSQESGVGGVGEVGDGGGVGEEEGRIMALIALF